MFEGYHGLCFYFFIFSHKQDAESIMKNEEDRQFLVSMKSDRKAYFSGFDHATEAFYKRKEERERKEDERKKKSEEEKRKLETVSTGFELDEIDPMPCTSSDFPSPKPVSHKRYL